MKAIVIQTFKEVYLRVWEVQRSFKMRLTNNFCRPIIWLPGKRIIEIFILNILSNLLYLIIYI